MSQPFINPIDGAQSELISLDNGGYDTGVGPQNAENQSQMSHQVRLMYQDAPIYPLAEQVNRANTTTPQNEDISFTSSNYQMSRANSRTSRQSKAMQALKKRQDRNTQKAIQMKQQLLLKQMDDYVEDAKQEEEQAAQARRDD